MKSPVQSTPPRWATAILLWYCKPELVEDLAGDLQECFERNVNSKGLFRAKLIYTLDVIKFLRPYTMRKPSVLDFLMQWVMVGSYVKTSGRTIVRNKLFSAINIIGLAVSMSVGLLMIAFISDLKSYDSFHINKDRIYTIQTLPGRQGSPAALASTSLKLGKDIQDNPTGIDQMLLMARGFYGDATTGKKTMQIGGMFASETFFKVFSFDLIQGNPDNALKEPYAMVLSEKMAMNLFATTDVLGKSVLVDTTNYIITGVMEDMPKLSHFHEDVLVSFSTHELQAAGPNRDGNMLSWGNYYSHYIYLLLSEKTNPERVQAALNKISETESKIDKDHSYAVLLQPISAIPIAKTHAANALGISFPALAVWIMEGLALVVVLSACFNYTNLSIARATRRGREVGIRKVIGASNGNVLAQFIAESIIFALMALVSSFGLFLFIRTQFRGLDPFIDNMVSLELSTSLIGKFILMTIVVGFAGGFLPALYFSKIKPVQVLKDAAGMKVFKTVSLRKALVVVQYCFSLIFISTTVIGNQQYSGLVNLDLGYTTDNILNIKMQGNKSEILKSELSKIPDVGDISISRLVTSIGNIYGERLVANGGKDTINVFLNVVDEHYLKLHNHQFVAGRDFIRKSSTVSDGEIILTWYTFKKLNIGIDPQKAIGQVASVDGKPVTIVGVVKDFRIGTAQDHQEASIFRYSSEEAEGYLNVVVKSSNLPGTMEAIKQAWTKIDHVHSFEAEFYNDQIQKAYAQFSVMVKVFGFLSFLAVCIASMGLFGMVVYTTETRQKEVSIRKVMGASSLNLVLLLSKGFITLLIISACIALPATFYFFDMVVLSSFEVHEPISILNMIFGFIAVSIVAFIMIGSQTFKVAGSNPADVLKNE